MKLENFKFQAYTDKPEFHAIYNAQSIVCLSIIESVDREKPVPKKGKKVGSFFVLNLCYNDFVLRKNVFSDKQ